MAKRRIAIVGGGASGLTAAITAARQGAHVILLEHKDRVGKKILATGNGRCNYTNARMDSSCFYAGDQRGETESKVVASLLDRYPTEKILDFFSEIGVEPSERDGYYYPASGQASAILDCLRSECDRLDVEIHCDTDVLSVQPISGGFRIKTQPIGENAFTSNIKVDRVILCCGGQASPVTGSDGSGFSLAADLGHRIIEPFPALTGLKADPKRFKPLAGIRTKVHANLMVDGKNIREEEGELQLTENGLSGIVIFQLSHPAIGAYLKKKKVEIHINFLPQWPVSEVFGRLRQRRDQLGYKELQEWGVGLFPKKLWLQICKEAGFSLTLPASQLDNRSLARLQAVITDFTVPIIGYLGYDRAQVTAGGVDLREIVAETFESRKISGLYFAGEILDVDGICGGYNLHFAWASGMAAAKAACR